MGSSQAKRVFTPSNMPVSMKKGQTIVVRTGLPRRFSSMRRDSSKPTAANFEAE